jgi:hypothetical protein
MTRLPELVFSFAGGQNHFFIELAEALVDELGQQGVDARLAFDEFPEPARGRVCILMPPHEYVRLSQFEPSAGMLASCIGISAEQPNSHFFGDNARLASQFGSVFDINRRAIRSYQRAGIVVHHLPLGYTRGWDRFDSDERDIDILFMGRYTQRRGRALASYAELFERFRCHIQLSDNSMPSTAAAPDFLTDEDKRSLLSRSKVLLSIHGEEEPYFEWLRIIEGICGGCMIVSEHSTDIEPLVPGTHFVTGTVDRLGLLCAWAVDDDDARASIRRAGYDLLRERQPLSIAAARLAQEATRLDALPVLGDSRHARVRFMAARRAGSAIGEFEPPAASLDATNGAVPRALKSQALSILALRRQLSALEARLAAGGAAPNLEPQVVHESAAWSNATSGGRAVAVIIPLYNHAAEILDALQSVVDADVRDWECVVVDDGSSDGGGEIVRAFMQDHPDHPWRLVSHPVNRGLPHARNTGIAHTTAGLLMMLDADNALRRTTLTRLGRALDEDPAAAFAYGIIEQFDDNGPVGLVSALPWNPRRLRRGNYIDALAMLRRETLEALGGYSTDPRLHGWEDYDLWLRLAESGGHGAFVPEIVARYRVGASSMISFTNLSTVDAFGALIEHAPELMRDIRLR